MSSIFSPSTHEPARLESQQTVQNVDQTHNYQDQPHPSEDTAPQVVSPFSSMSVTTIDEVLDLSDDSTNDMKEAPQHLNCKALTTQ